MLKDNHEICPAFLLPSLCYPFVIFWLTCLGLIFKGLPWYDDDFGVDEVLWDLLQWFFCDKLCIKCHILFVNEFAGRWTNPSRSAPPPFIVAMIVKETVLKQVLPWTWPPEQRKAQFLKLEIWRKLTFWSQWWSFRGQRSFAGLIYG